MKLLIGSQTPYIKKHLSEIQKYIMWSWYKYEIIHIKQNGVLLTH